MTPRPAASRCRSDILTLWYNSFDDLIAKPNRQRRSVRGQCAGDGAVRRWPDPADSAARGSGAGSRRQREAGTATPSRRRRPGDQHEFRFRGPDPVRFEARRPLKIGGDLPLRCSGRGRTSSTRCEKMGEGTSDHREGKEEEASRRDAEFVDNSIPNLSSVVVLADLATRACC